MERTLGDSLLPLFFFLCIIKDGKTKLFCVRVLYVFNTIGMDRWIYMACINKKNFFKTIKKGSKKFMDECSTNAHRHHVY